MILSTLQKALNDIAPLNHAEPWDNVGLLAGDPQQAVNNILLTIDYTRKVAAEAQSLKCDLVIAYHPPLFAAVKRITAAGADELIYDAIRRGVAIYSPHTAWDAAAGGTNDYLAEMLGLTQVTPLQTIQSAAEQFKLVTFVPESHVEAVSNALFAVGAGDIGNYHSCSFRTPGVGTFFGRAGTSPTIGKPGILERQPEIRLETIVPVARTGDVIRALMKSHPYEEPAFDLSPLASLPGEIGHGRIGALSTGTSMDAIAAKIKAGLELDYVIIASAEKVEIQQIAICAGAGGELLNDAIHREADLFVTGELRHHDALKAVNAGMNVICTLHSNSERGSLRLLMARLRDALPDLPRLF